MFDKVDKITALLLGLGIVVVGLLAAVKDITGEAALGFISGIVVSLLSHTAVKVAVSQSNTNPQPATATVSATENTTPPTP